MKISFTAVHRLIIVMLLAGFLLGNKTEDPKNIEIRGIYGSPDAFWKKNLRLDQLGVNAVFIHDRSIHDSMMKRARALRIENLCRVCNPEW